MGLRLESSMTILKKLERELIIEWQQLQLETIPEIKAAAIKAYYLKYALYRKAKVWNAELIHSG